MMRNYPNLELLAYKATECFNKEYKDRIPENGHPSFDIIVFPQNWGSTCTGFDVCDDGSPAMGGCAITREYTTVVCEIHTSLYFVFFGDRLCYVVDDPTDKFYKDLTDRNLLGLSRALVEY